MTAFDLDRLIYDFQRALVRWDSNGSTMRELLNQQKEIFASLKAVKFATREDNQKAWQRFQELLAKLKEKQDWIRQENQKFAVEVPVGNTGSSRPHILNQGASPSYNSTRCRYSFEWSVTVARRIFYLCKNHEKMHLISLVSIGLLFSLVFAQAYTQTPIKPTDSLVIGGEVDTVKILFIKDIAAMPSVKLKDIPITNHKGEAKGKLEGLRGVPMKSILEGVSITCESAKVLSEFYLVFEASDGYTVVFSWNEVFNSKTGDNMYLLTEMGGKSLTEMEQRIAFVTPTDVQTGRRYVKSLARIMVRRAK